MRHAGRDSTTDEGGQDSDDAEGTDPIASQGGMGGGGGIAPVGGGGLFSPMRRYVWERSNPSWSSPAFTKRNKSTARPFGEPPRPRDPPPSSSALSNAPIESDMPTSENIPKVNYKHLYLVHRRLLRRMRDPHFIVKGQESASSLGKAGPSRFEPVRPVVLDAISSIQAGGLPGHSDTIYSLSLVRHRMSVPVRVPQDGSGMSGPFESLMTLTGLSRSPPDEACPPDAIITGRDWLLSGSRDRTLRLWTLNGVRPKVVKIFHGGHEGSILSHCVLRTSDETEGTGGGHRGRESLVAISGGSDGRVCLWDIEDGEGTPRVVVNAHSDSVLCVRGNTRHIVTCSKGELVAAVGKCWR